MPSSTSASWASSLRATPTPAGARRATSRRRVRTPVTDAETAQQQQQQQQQLLLRTEIEAAQVLEDQANLERHIALSAKSMEEQLQSVRCEAAEVLTLCDSTAGFTDEVREGLRQCRISMGEQRAAVDAVLNSVGDRLSQAQTVMSGDRSDSRNHMALSSGGGPAGEQRSVQIAPPPWSSQQNAANAHVSSDTSDRDAKRMWKIEWLTQKLENVETAHTARVRQLEEELRVVRARHSDGLIRIRELEEQMYRVGTAGTAAGVVQRRRGDRTSAQPISLPDPRQSKLERDVDILLTRVEKLRREVKQGRTAELDEMELAEQERKALMAELLDLEQALQRSRIQQSVPAENARLRLQVLRHTEELAALEGQGDPLANSRAQVRDLEAQLSRAKAEIRDLEDCLDHAQEDKDALASEVERWNQPRQA